MRLFLAATLAAAVVASAAVSASADTAPVADSPDLPWTNPDHTSPLELLLSQVASRIAGKDVTVRCEGDTDWQKLVVERGGDPNAELGFVGIDYSRRTGALRSVEGFTELSGGKVCLPLKRFAAAAVKPTKCVVTQRVTSTVYVSRRVGGVATRVPTRVVRKVTAPPAPCYLGNQTIARRMPDAFWDGYWDYANAILTVAHEAVHLGGTVGFRYGAFVVGDPEAEAKATCWGMQWMAWVAQQLGATADDAHAIALYYWENVYPEYRGGSYASYWSADCRPGGRLDLRLPGAAAWPS
jgi:hypothetical protein